MSGSNLAQEREQVERHTRGILAHDSAWMGAAWVEVSQQGTIPLLIWLPGLLCICALGLNEISDHQLDRALCPSVWVGGADGAVLGDGNHIGNSSGIAVDGRRRREDNVVYVVLLHASEEGDRSAHVDTVVFQGNLARFAHSLM